MAEPFKNFFNIELIKSMAQHLLKSWPEFDDVNFVKYATNDFERLELKQRSNQITDALVELLPSDFEKSALIIRASLADDNRKDGIAGWAIAPMTYYIALKGKEHFDLSLNLLKDMTKLFTSEFDVRFFLISDQDRTLATLSSWLDDPDHHVRRLISEGTRPRLPWGVRLQSFVEDPTPIIPFLEALKDDDEEYVRRSVANNLNDIAKDHPDLVASIAKDWLKGADKNRQRLVKHACRTLIKQGHQKTLVALGYSTPEVELISFNILTPIVEFGNALEFDIALKSVSDQNQNLIIDYAIHHQKANGKTSPKVFKWKTLVLKENSDLDASRRHKIKKITTRVYYPGIHLVEIFINGISFGTKEFELKI